MWDGLFMLLVLSGIMALASFFAGSLPLSFSLSQRQMRLISAMGTGLLIGTALIVIIPEGIETLYSASSSLSVHSTSVSMPEMGAGIGPGAPTRGGAAPLALHEMPKLGDDTKKKENDNNHFLQHDASEIKGTDRLRPGEEEPKAPTKNVRRDEHDHEEGESSSHAWIGISLISGFILMYLIDIVPSISPSSTRLQSNGTTHHIPLSTLDPDTLPSSSSPPLTSLRHPPTSRPNPTTIGLLIHALADGIALGASSTSPSSSTSPTSSIGLVVFIAILVHKAPAAFGLTSLLLNQGISKRAARAHLLLFSIAAPLGALATWIFINLLGTAGPVQSQDSAGNRKWWTGIALIFSGGTFLYVALHAMQTISSSSSEGHGHLHSSIPLSRASTVDENEYDGDMSGPYGGSAMNGEVSQGKTRGEVGLVVLGMLLPLLTQIGHAHAHG